MYVPCIYKNTRERTEVISDSLAAAKQTHVYHPSASLLCKLLKFIVEVALVWYTLVVIKISCDVGSIIKPVGDNHVMLMKYDPITANVNEALPPLLMVTFCGFVTITRGTRKYTRIKLLCSFTDCK